MPLDQLVLQVLLLDLGPVREYIESLIDPVSNAFIALLLRLLQTAVAAHVQHVCRTIVRIGRNDACVGQSRIDAARLSFGVVASRTSSRQSNVARLLIWLCRSCQWFC